MTIRMGAARLARMGDSWVLVLPHDIERDVLRHAEAGLEVHFVPRRG